MPKTKTSTTKKSRKSKKDVLPEVTVGMKVVITGDRKFPTAGVILRGTEGTVTAIKGDNYTVEFFEGGSVIMKRKDFLTQQTLKELGITRW